MDAQAVSLAGDAGMHDDTGNIKDAVAHDFTIQGDANDGQGHAKDMLMNGYGGRVERWVIGNPG